MPEPAPIWEPFNPWAALGSVPSVRRQRPVRAVRPGKRPATRLAFAMLWLLVFAIPWENLIVLPGIGTAGRIAGLAAFAAGLFAFLDSGRLRVPSGFHLLMAAFVLWAGATYFWSIEPERTLVMAGTYAQLLGMVWLIWQYAPEKQDQWALMGAYLLGSYVSSIQTILAYFHKSPMQNYERYAARGFDPNDLGLILALSVPFGIYMSVVQRSGLRAWIYRMQPVFAVTAILFTASRGALIALVIALTIVPLMLRKWSFKIKAAYSVVAVCGVVAAVILVPESSFRRLAGTTDELRSGSLNQRRVIWQAGAESFRNRPVEGVGAGGFSPSVARIVSNPAVGESVAHNSFLSVLVEEGIIGLSLFLGFILALMFAAFDLPRLERCLWIVVGATWIVGVSALTWESRKPGWFLFGLLAAQLATRSLAVNIRPSARSGAGPVRARAASATAPAFRSI